MRCFSGSVSSIIILIALQIQTQVLLEAVETGIANVCSLLLYAQSII